VAQSLGLGVLLLAAFSLGGLALILLRLSVLGQIPSEIRLRSWYQYLWLSLLHWGWGIVWMPVLAVYLGVVGVATVTLSRPERMKIFPAANPPSAPQQHGPHWPSLETSLVVYGLGLLFIRAIFVAQIQLTQLGLAIAIGGFLLAWTAFRRITPETVSATEAAQPGTVPPVRDTTPRPSRSAYAMTLPQRSFSQLALSPWEMVGLVLVFGGWGLTVATLPWQAVGVSILAMLLLGRRLLHTWSRADLAVLLLIGLQMIWLGWDMVPDVGQQYASDLGERLVGSQGQPWAALSLVMFPYVMVIVALSDWLARHWQRDLAQFSGWLALGLGIGLAGLGTLNPTLRFLNLLASTILLAIVTRRRWRQWGTRSLPGTPNASRTQPVKRIQHLATLTHVVALLTVAAFISRLLPALPLTGWAAVVLALMIAEWIFSLGPTVDVEASQLPGGLTRLLRQSAWPLCLVLGALTLEVLYFAGILALQGWGAFAPVWGLIGLSVPALLTAMAARVPSRQPLTTWMSTAGLLVLPPLFWPISPTRLVGMGIATVLMGLNSRYLLKPMATHFTIGFSLLLAGAGLYEIVGPNPVAIPPALLGATLLLWIGRQLLLNRQTPLSKLNRSAMDQWAFGLSGITLAACVLMDPLPNDPIAMIFPPSNETIAPLVAITALGLMVTTTYRSCQPHSRQATYGFSGGMILLAQLVLVGQIPWQSLGLALGTGLMMVHTRRLRQRLAAIAALGLAVALFVSLAEPIAPQTIAALLVVMSLATFALWGFWFFLRYRPSRLAVVYRKGADVWGLGLGILDSGDINDSGFLRR
jgi:hypothetical protein